MKTKLLVTITITITLTMLMITMALEVLQSRKLCKFRKMYHTSLPTNANPKLQFASLNILHLQLL